MLSRYWYSIKHLLTFGSRHQQWCLCYFAVRKRIIVVCSILQMQLFMTFRLEFLEMELIISITAHTEGICPKLDNKMDKICKLSRCYLRDYDWGSLCSQGNTLTNKLKMLWQFVECQRFLESTFTLSPVWMKIFPHRGAETKIDDLQRER